MSQFSAVLTDVPQLFCSRDFTFRSFKWQNCKMNLDVTQCYNNSLSSNSQIRVKREYGPEQTVSLSLLSCTLTVLQLERSIHFNAEGYLLK